MNLEHRVDKLMDAATGGREAAVVRKNLAMARKTYTLYVWALDQIAATEVADPDARLVDHWREPTVGQLVKLAKRAAATTRDQIVRVRQGERALTMPAVGEALVAGMRLEALSDFLKAAKAALDASGPEIPMPREWCTWAMMCMSQLDPETKDEWCRLNRIRWVSWGWTPAGGAPCGT
jgi:hypothetical protein